MYKVWFNSLLVACILQNFFDTRPWKIPFTTGNGTQFVPNFENVFTEISAYSCLKYYLQ